jgi:hypothetical protein
MPDAATLIPVEDLAAAPRPDFSQPPTPSFAVTPAEMLDEETLDLSVPEPQPTAHLAFEFADINTMKRHIARPPDFTIEEVSEPAERLITFQRSSFDLTPGNRQGCWAIEPGRSLPLKLNLDERDQLTLTFEVYVPEDPSVRALYQSCLAAPVWQAPLQFEMFSAGTPALYQALPENPLGRDFIKITTPLLPLTNQRVGVNECWLRYSGDLIKPLLVRSVTLKRFRVQPQQQTQWCWAAVTASLLNVLSPINAAQSEVVNRTLTPAQIAENANRPFDITEAAKQAGLQVKYTSRSLPLWDVRDGINQGLPIPLQINWKKDGQPEGELGSGHYVVLTAIGPDDPRGEEGGEDHTIVIVEDPFKGRLEMTWAELKDDYPGAANKHLYNHPVSGTWTYTHRIVKAPAKAAKVSKARVPKFTGLAGRTRFSHQWAQFRPVEDDDQRRQALQRELKLLKELEERLLRSEFQARGLAPTSSAMQKALAERDAQLTALQQHFIRLFWVRELLPPEAFIADDTGFFPSFTKNTEPRGFFADPRRAKVPVFRP